MAVLYGVLNMADLKDVRVTEVGVEQTLESIRQTFAEHERQMNATLPLFARSTTLFKRRFRTPVASRLQPLDNSGRARPIKPAGKYDVEWPIQMAGAAWGHDYVTGEKMTVGDAALATETVIDGDFRWMIDHLYAALFFKNGTSGWSFEDEENGALTVRGLANGDTTTYNVFAGAADGATDDHLLADATITAAGYQEVYDELIEHPENSGEVITFIASNMVSTTEGLSGFIEKDDPDIRQGTATAVLTGNLGVNVPGMVLGKIEKQWIVELKTLPDSYSASVMTGGERPLAMREDPEANLRGFKEVARRDDHPWYERQYLRRAGFGAWNRVGAVAKRWDDASYAVPSGFESPMA